MIFVFQLDKLSKWIGQEIMNLTREELQNKLSWSKEAKKHLLLLNKFCYKTLNPPTCRGLLAQDKVNSLSVKLVEVSLITESKHHELTGWS